MTARLILLNGPPGIGKSTLAQRYVDEHPLTLDLDLDTVRRMLGRWQDHPIDAGLLARAMTLEMARVHLRAGYEVIIPQYLGRPRFLEQAEEVARDVSVPFREFVLMDGRDSSVRRFIERTDSAATEAHVEAGALLARLGGRVALEAMYDRLLLVLSHRPNAQVVQSRDGAADTAYAELCRLLSDG
ncbi:MAG: AAA family ATPase [Jatrophihabitantaceae bacterium]